MEKQEKEQSLSVSGAMALAKGALEGVTVKIVGEVSEFSNKSGYKAVYFTVKDKAASLPCMMWTNRYNAAGVELAVGRLVEITGRFTLYAAKGRMNFDVFSVAIAGEGNLRMQVANLARALEAEGLMDPQKKLPLPEYPLTIGLVTSPRGDAVHDVLRTLRRRFPLARVVVAGVPVEGVNAAQGIIEGMRCVLRARSEVILLVRGGGTFEDYMPFNDENLVRAISKCPIPVVTGIGHEPDTCISDMVADVRASTPTGAAEAVSPSVEHLAQVFDSCKSSLDSSVSRIIERSEAVVGRYQSRPLFKDAQLLFAAEAQSLDFYADRLNRAIPANLERDLRRLDTQHQRLSVAGSSLVLRFQQQAALAAARLNDLSPLAVLGRGYAIARTCEGDVVKSVSQCHAGGVVDVVVSDGSLACRVEDVRFIETEVVSWED